MSREWRHWGHTLADTIRCPGCDQWTSRLVQRTDGITLLDATCVPCSELGAPARNRARTRKPSIPRKGRGAEVIRSRLLT